MSLHALLPSGKNGNKTHVGRGLCSTDAEFDEGEAEFWLYTDARATETLLDVAAWSAPYGSENLAPLAVHTSASIAVSSAARPGE
jgi:hypothetical protein